MKTSIHFPYHQARIWLGLVALLAALGDARAQLNLNIPNAGSDLALNIKADTVSTTNISVAGTNVVIDLSKAVTGIWDGDNAANAGKGVYDSNKWAVVFKYSSVSIAEGMQVSFKNHPSRAPVVWLVNSNVTIGENCTLNLNGTFTRRGTIETLVPAEPGPGGFRGPAEGPTGRGFGFGPGAENGSATYRATYGNPSIIPLMGGSGSSVTDSIGLVGGFTSGGGAILIVAGDTVTLDGKILAKPGSLYDENTSFAASGGAIRIVAHKFLGGVAHDFPGGIVDAEPQGRIRIEANEVSDFLKLSPNAGSAPPGTNHPPIIWPSATAPEVRVVSVDGQGAPADPLAGVSTTADSLIGKNSPVQIIMESRNLPIQGVVRLRVGPKYAGAVWHTATFVSGDINQALWRVTTTLPPGFTVLQARATAP